MSTIEPPLIQSREFLSTAGRALMRWYNERGPVLSSSGEAYRAWWKRTYVELADDFFAPSDVYEQLRYYADVAREEWLDSGKRGAPPPTYERAQSIASEVVSGGWMLLVGVAVLVFALRAR